MERQSHDFHVGVVLDQCLHCSVWMHHDHSYVLPQQPLLFPTYLVGAARCSSANICVHRPLFRFLRLDLVVLFLLGTLQWTGPNIWPSVQLVYSCHEFGIPNTRGGCSEVIFGDRYSCLHVDIRLFG